MKESEVSFVVSFEQNPDSESSSPELYILYLDEMFNFILLGIFTQ